MAGGVVAPTRRCRVPGANSWRSRRGLLDSFLRSAGIGSSTGIPPFAPLSSSLRSHRVRNRAFRGRPPTGPSPGLLDSLTPVRGARKLPHSFALIRRVARASRLFHRLGESPMPRGDQWKLLSVIVATALSIWYLWPSYRYYSLTPEQRNRLPHAELAELRRKAIHLGLDLQGGMHLLLEVDRSKLSTAEAKDAVDRAMEVLRNRVDQFGVAEPLIQREGENRIVVQLPGLTDRTRARELLGKTAQLEFKLVRTPEEAKSLFQRLDNYLAARGAGVAAKLDTALQHQPLTGHFMDFGGSSAFVRLEDTTAVGRLLATSGLDSIIPGDSQILWTSQDQNYQGVTGRSLYVLKRSPEMSGASIATAEARVGLESTNPGAWGVSMTMTPKGRADFARVTGNNVGRQLAIILDDKVSSAPVIRERIPSGDASITGSFGIDEAKDLAIVLRAGALPAPVRIIEERSVGPSLGSDSIQR